MLSVCHSNKLEPLAERMAELLRQPAPAVPPLQSELIAVENSGMARWLSMQLAGQLGVAANLGYHMPAAFIWRLLAKALPELPQQSAYNPQILSWRLLQRLLQPHGLPQELAENVKASEGVGLYELASRLAVCYDQYMLFRPDWIRRWQKGEQPDHWQAQLWRELRAEDDGPHWLAACDKLRSVPGFAPGSKTTSVDLPPRMFLFGISTLSPAYLEVLKLFARHSQIYMFVLNPCQQYWGHIDSKKRMARLQVQDNPMQHYSETGHQLLASLGGQGKEFVDKVLEISDDMDNLSEHPGDDTMLHRLQTDILQLTESGGRHGRHDRSIQVHICHSIRREVEVLYDQLLHMFARLPQLSPSEIVVMAPDIEAYAPYIEAVFDTGGHKLPYSIADRSDSSAASAVEAMLQLLELGSSRLVASEWLPLLQLPACAARFGISQEQIPDLTMCLQQAGIRWGVDQRHWQQHGLQAARENTWQHGVQRLLLGYAVSSDMPEYDGLPAAAIGSSHSALVGSLCSWLERLEHWRGRLRQGHTLQQWADALTSLREDFLNSEFIEQTEWRAISEAIDSLRLEAAAARIDCIIPVEEVRASLQQRLSLGSKTYGFMGQGITFCRMVPMRSIPFRVVCLMGMSFEQYPRAQRSPDFDLMRDSHRPGDRGRRNDDRYLFLEAICAAKEVLYLSYSGRSAYDNSELPPSILLEELLETIKLQEGGIEGVQTTHRLQAFHPEYFSGSMEHFSYDAAAAKLATISSGSHTAPFLPAVAQQSQPGATIVQEIVSCSELQQFFRHPQRHYLRHTMNVRQPYGEESLPSSEAFTIDHLEMVTLKRQLLHSLDQGGAADADRLARRLRSDGLLPLGQVGQSAYDQWQVQIQNLLHSISADDLEAWRASHSISTSINPRGMELQGEQPQTSMVHVHATEPSKRDAICCWLQHLVACAAGHKGGGRCHYLQKDGRPNSWRWQVPPDAKALLQELMDYYLQGCAEALYYSPRLSYAHCEALSKKDAEEEKTLATVQSMWYGNSQIWGECGDFYLSLLWRGQDMEQLFVGEAFRTQSEKILLPMMQSRQP